MTRRLEYLGLLATAFAVLGVLLNNDKIIWCFPAWLVSNGLTLYLHVRGRMWSLGVRDAIFLILAVVGWVMWAK